MEISSKYNCLVFKIGYLEFAVYFPFCNEVLTRGWNISNLVGQKVNVQIPR